jgi:hypothetical protein
MTTLSTKSGSVTTMVCLTHSLTTLIRFMDAEHELLVLNGGKMLGDPAGDYTL